MKRHTTRFLKSVSAFFAAFPLVYIIMAATLFDIPFRSCMSILLSPFYYILCFLVAITGYGLWELRRWSWYVLVLSQLLIVYENAVFVFNFSESHHKAVAYLIALACQLALVFKISQSIRVPYMFPKIRWWESNPRYRLSIPVTLIRSNGEKAEGEILDLTPVGCFVKLRSDFNQDESLGLEFKVYGQSMECRGLAVWLTQSTVTHPRGIGIKFDPLQKTQKRSLRLVKRKLKKIANHYRKFRYLLSPDEFSKKLEEIETEDKIA